MAHENMGKRLQQQWQGLTLLSVRVSHALLLTPGRGQLASAAHWLRGGTTVSLGFAGEGVRILPSHVVKGCPPQPPWQEHPHRGTEGTKQKCPQNRKPVHTRLGSRWGFLNMETLGGVVWPGRGPPFCCFHVSLSPHASLTQSKPPDCSSQTLKSVASKFCG